MILTSYSNLDLWTSNIVFNFNGIFYIIIFQFSRFFIITSWITILFFDIFNHCAFLNCRTFFCLSCFTSNGWYFLLYNLIISWAFCFTYFFRRIRKFIECLLLSTIFNRLFVLSLLLFIWTRSAICFFVSLSLIFLRILLSRLD